MGASTLATLLIRLGFDTSGLAGGAAAAKSAMNSVGAAGPQMANQVNNAVSSMEAKMRSAANTASFLKTTLATALGFAGAGILASAFQFAENAMIGFNARLEQARIGFTTMLGSAGAADVFIKKMQDFANITPFEFSGLQEAVQRMLAVGFESDKVLDTLRSIGDAVAALGGNTETLNRVVYVMSQIKTAGRLVGQDMMQLTSAGIPAWQMLADAMGKSVAQVRKLVTDGLVPAEDAIEIITKGMEERFGGMMAKQARTFQGAMSTIKDAALSSIAGAVKPAFDLLAVGMVGLADFLTSGGGKMIGPLLIGIGTALMAVVVPGLMATTAALIGAKVAILGVATPILPLIVAVTLFGIALQENFGGIRDIIEANLRPLLFIVGAISAVLIGRWVVALYMSTVAMAQNLAATVQLSAGYLALQGRIFDLLAIGQFRAALLALLGPLALVTVAVTALAIAFGEAQKRIAEGEAGLAKAVSKIIDEGDLAALKHAREVVVAEIEKIKNASLIGGNLFETVGNAFGQLFGMNGVAEFQGQLDALDAAIATTTASTANNVTTASGKVVDATGDMVDQLGTSMSAVVEAAGVAGADAMSAMADGILEAEKGPVEAYKKLQGLLVTEMTTTAAIARDVGILMSSELALGLADGRPAVRAAAIATQKFVLDDLNERTGGAFAAGTKFGTAWNDAFNQSMQAGGQIPALTTGIEGGPGATVIAQARVAYAALGATWKNDLAPGADTAKAALTALNAEVASGASIADAAASIVAQFGNNLGALREIAATAGSEMVTELASAIENNQQEPLDAMRRLMDSLRDAMAPDRQEALLIGLLISKQLAAGLASGIPEVFLKATLARDAIMTQLNNLQPGAYAAGASAIIALAAGMLSPSAFAALNKAAAAARLMTAIVAGSPAQRAVALTEWRNAVNLVVPSFTAANNAAAGWGRSLNAAGSAMGNLASDAKSKLGNAFDDVRDRAHEFFDELHDRNIQAINDVHQLANAKLDAEQKAIQGTVDAAQEQLNRQRQMRQYQDLRRAVATATTPESSRSAQEALQDFVAQARIDSMQKAADAAIEGIDARRKANDERATLDKAAEDERSANQIRSFDKQLDALREHLDKHPGLWRKSQRDVLALLDKFGVDYEGAGTMLGKKFVAGINSQVAAAAAAARALVAAGSGSGTVPYAVTPGVTIPRIAPSVAPKPTTLWPGGPSQYAVGAWRLMEDQLAFLHAGEMVVPAAIADSLRAVLSAQGRGDLSGLEGLFAGQESNRGWATMAGGLFAQPSGALNSAMPNGAEGSGAGTFIFKIGEEVIDEMIDRRLAIRETIYRTVEPTASSTR